MGLTLPLKGEGWVCGRVGCKCGRVGDGELVGWEGERVDPTMEG